MLTSVKFFICALSVSLSFNYCIINASEFNPESSSFPSKRTTPEGGFDKEDRNTKKMRISPQNLTQAEKVDFYLPLEVLNRILKFTDLQSFYCFKLVSKEIKKETEREEYQIPEGKNAINWILSFKDKNSHLFDYDSFIADFLMRNRHTKDSLNRLFNAANLYGNHNSLFRFKGLFYGHVSSTEDRLSPVCARLLEEIESLEKDHEGQASNVIQEKRQQLKEMLLVWQPYAIAHDLAQRLFAQDVNSIWDSIGKIAQKCSTLQPYLSNPYIVGFYGSDLGLEQLPKLQQALLILRDQIANQEIVKASQLRNLARLEYINTLYRYFELQNMYKDTRNEIDRLEIRQELQSIPNPQLVSFSKFSKLFDSLPPLFVSDEELYLFDTVESWLDNLQKKLTFKPQGTARNRIKHFDQFLAYVGRTVKIIESYLNTRDEVYPFASFYKVLIKLNKLREELPYAYAKAAQEAHDLADLTQQEEALTRYEQEAYFLEQQSYYSDLPSKAEGFIKSAQRYAKAGHLLQESDSLKANEFVKKASQTALNSLKYLMKLSETDYPDIYSIFKEVASLIIPSDKARAAKFCEETANFIKRGDRYIDCVEAALSYIIAGEFIKETEPAKASILFEKADDQQLTLTTIIKDEGTDIIDLTPEDAEEISDAYKEAGLCLELYNKEKAATFYTKAEEFKKYAEDFGDESSQSSVTDGD